MTANQKLYPARVSTTVRSGSNTKRIATEGEAMAASYLEQQGYHVIVRNFRAGRAGEIDIIALNAAQIIVFVEVKTRRLERVPFGIPEVGFEAVGYKKQQRIIRTAQAYLSARDFTGGRWRYDVIVIHLFDNASRSPEAKPHIIHVEDAFR